MSQRMLIASLMAAGMIGRLEFKPIHDTDVFWQVKLGQIMLEERRLPLEDRFTYTHAGEPAPPIGWLAQALFASLHGLGGWGLTRLVHHCALIGALLAAAATCRPPSTTPFSTAIAMTIGFLVMLSNVDLRPQSLALASFATLLTVARSELSFKKKLMIAVPLVVAWQNMHPSVVVGAVALAGLTAADFLDSRQTRTGRWQSVVLTVLAACAQFATPLRADVLAVARSNLRIGRDVLHLAEWGPPWDPKVVAAVSPFWIAFVRIADCDRQGLRRQVAPRDRALLIVMSILSLYATRFIIFWAVALVPFWAQVVERIVPRDMFSSGARSTPSGLFRASRSIFGPARGSDHRAGHPSRPFQADCRARDSARRRQGSVGPPPGLGKDLQRLRLGGPPDIGRVTRLADRRRRPALLLPRSRRMAIDQRRPHRPNLDRRDRTNASPRRVFPLPGRRDTAHQRVIIVPALARMF